MGTNGTQIKTVKIDEQLLNLYLMEVRNQAQFLMIAAKDMDMWRQQGDMDRFWYSAQSFLVAAANLSKLLWGSSDEATTERKPLRDRLKVKDRSPLKPKGMRNIFEHFDENIQKWFNESTHKIFVDRNIAPAGRLGDFAIGDNLRNYDPERHILSYRGRKYNFIPVYSEAKRIYELTMSHM
ncbi:hypothetical protein [Bacillus sp. UNC438CL73TsuS30]|uniref:hypothetical protein n=1 Tax=Bacillus sp. UNC438CL73TsuS30 TaxID=1340434 RepID=UPI000478DCC5|nr:hypothetical protein [Bacillus sp. UNC438CL73TsuS30]